MNATMYSPERSKIRILGLVRSHKLCIQVEDDGPGIPEAYVTHIFEKFYRVPGSRTGGTGLGLSIVKSIVELHRGQVRMENRQPHGARFIVELPIEKQPPGPTEGN
jgi:two-component system sensor histidine kinase KdpD